jgi:flagellar hook-associated protein 3 FlgL
MTNRLYLRNNNMTKKNMTDAYTRILTQKKYTRTSQDPLTSEKSMSIRKGLRDLDVWDDNISTSHELFLTAEKSLYQVSSNLYGEVNTRLVQGSTTTIGSVGMMAVAVELEQTADEMCDALNADFNTRQMFAGASQNKTPFTIETIDVPVMRNGNYVTAEDGKIYAEEDGYTINAGGELVDPEGNVVENGGVTFADWENGDFSQESLKTRRACYNGIDMATIYQNEDDGLFYGTAIDKDGNRTADTLVPGQGTVLIDIGLGAAYDENFNLDPNTAFDTALHGFKILGYGSDDEGYPKNLIQLTLDAANIAHTGDLERVGELSQYIDKTAESVTNISTAITELGVRYTSLEYYTTKNEDSRSSLRERQNTVEGSDVLKDITDYYAIEAAYNASLQMGANILPMSIFDFI